MEYVPYFNLKYFFKISKIFFHVFFCIFYNFIIFKSFIYPEYVLV